MATNDYIISGGMDGKTRLNLLSGVLNPYTKQLLRTLGIATGSSFLDMGCGGGNVSIMVANMIGNTGHVVAVDFDDQIIALAEQDAISQGVHNISFKTASAYDVSLHHEFGTAYARFLLSHLKSPAKVLDKMMRSVKPGGKVIMEDVQFSGHFCHPACDAFNQYLDYYTALALRNGQDPEMGITLFSLFQQAGLSEVGVDMIQPTFSSGPGKWMAWITLDRIKQALIENELATLQTVDELLRELEKFTNDESTIISMPRIFRVWGTRK